MKIKFWGTRGSLPAPLNARQVQEKVVQALAAAHGRDFPSEEGALTEWVRQHLPFATRGTYGGNSACVQVTTNSAEHILLDAGTGLRDFAHDYSQRHRQGSKPGFPADSRFHLLLSHLHWDHLQGLPFFYPIYAPGQHITIYGAHDKMEEAVRAQFSTPFFPVPYDYLKAKIDYKKLSPGQTYDIAGAKVSLCEQNHPGVSYGYRFEQGGKVFVYSTDCEHKQAEIVAPDYPLVNFFRDADLLVFDAMYSLEEAIYSKADWGHSSNVIGVELASRAQVRRLALFHHDPHDNDAELEETLFNTRMYAELHHQESGSKVNGPAKFPSEILGAYDGLEVEL